MLEVTKSLILDTDNSKSWYHLMAAPIDIQQPRLFASTFAGSILIFNEHNLKQAGFYTPNQLKDLGH